MALRMCIMQTTEKVTLTLPKTVMQSVREMSPARGQSKFIAAAIEKFIADKKAEALRQELIAGYQATAEQTQSIQAEFATVDQESWNQLPDYPMDENDETN